MAAGAATPPKAPPAAAGAGPSAKAAPRPKQPPAEAAAQAFEQGLRGLTDEQVVVRLGQVEPFQYDAFVIWHHDAPIESMPGICL
eukprot:12006854-Alexandrium_andersonii.AAC.1